MSETDTEDLTFSNLEFYRRNHGQQLYYSWSGTIWQIPTPGATPETLFSIVGMNATKVFVKDHPEYGEAGHRINRELAVYCHPETGEILYEWRSHPHLPPVPVVPIANRVVQGTVRPRDLTVPQGEAYKKVVNEIPLDYPHPLALDQQYRDYCPGERFQGTEYFTSYISRPGETNVPPAEWSRDCPWLPWMRLGYGNPARLRFETTIARVETFEELNPQLVALIRERVPLYEFTPDHTDEPNVTSITYFKKYFDAYLRGDRFPIPEE
ncbi:MAG: DUF1838 domain-containing protein [Merismopedia sp. SIO2A8]|nr:DUF1838 domain-containing protein [Merismopedia sp. SIO2A8]